MVSNEEVFEIYNLQAVKDVCDNIHRRHSILLEKMSDFNRILNRIEENWENKLGSDIASAIQNLRIVQSNMNGHIIPCYEELAGCIEALIDETILIQQKTV